MVAFVLDEPQTSRLSEVLEKDTGLAIWWCTEIEFQSAVARQMREKRMSGGQTAAALRRFEHLARAAHEVPPRERTRRIARRLVRVHPLKAADAFQLAAALSLAEDAPENLGFVCLDTKLGEAAAREGLRLLPDPYEGVS